MICTNCGKEIADGSTSCEFCGAPVETKKAKKKGGVIVAIIIVILLLVLAGIGVAAYLIINSPDMKIKKAVENNDIETICELYSDVKSDDVKKFVSDSMYNYVCDLEDQYVSEDIDYDTMKSDFDALGKAVLKKDKEFKTLVEDMDALKESRDNFKAAEKSFKNEDYQTAYDQYALVIKDDSNYKTAQKKMEECLEAMIPDVCGEYVYDYDLGPDLMDRLGLVDSGYTVYCPITINIDFYEDGTGRMYYDEDNYKAGMELAMEDLKDVVYGVLKEEAGLTKKEVDQFYKDTGYDSVDDWIYETCNLSNYDDYYAISLFDFEYEVIDENNIHIIEGPDSENTIFYYMDGDDFVLTGDDHDFFDLFFGLFDIELPMTFHN